ncbi:MAG: TetR/AcrR family transcriptional regulator [Chloroflexi bacterium]|nr:TetR/AcrR family transcriptional regulator [Chloroflexota bacterium]
MLPNEDERLDPRVKRTRQMIEQAFAALVTEKGFQSLSVQDITERAGLNRATFYAHFPDKFSLLDHAIQQEFRQEIDKRMLNACQFSINNLRSLMVTVCEFVDQAHAHCALSEQQFQLLIEAQVRSQIHGLLSHWLEGLPGGNQLHLNERATAASWALYGLATEWSRAKRMPPVEEFAEQVLPLLAANLGVSLEYEHMVALPA